MTTLFDILRDDLRPGLTPAERVALEKAPTGEPADFQKKDEGIDNPVNADKWGDDRTIRHELLEWLCTNEEATKLVHRKGVGIIGAKVKGRLDFGCTVLPRWLSLQFSSAVPEGILLDDAEVHGLNLAGTRTGPVTAVGLRTESDVYLDGVHVTGEVCFLRAFVAGHLSLRKAILTNPLDKAFSGDGLTVKGGMFFNGCRAEGEVRLLGASIAGPLECKKATFDNRQSTTAFDARGASISSALFDDATVEGTLDLTGARVTGQLSCQNAILNNPQGAAFCGDGLSVENGAFFENIRATGEVRLVAAEISRQFSCDNASFTNRHGEAFCAENLRINGRFFFRNLKNLVGSVNLQSAHVGELIDNQTSWPEKGKLLLDGFVYDRIAGDAKTPRSAKERLKWLRFQPDKPFHPQPYDQLARVFRQMGKETDAREVLIAKNDDMRMLGDLPRWLKPWMWVLKHTIAYGYKPWLALKYAIGILLLGWLLFYVADRTDIMQPSSERVYMDPAYVALGRLPAPYPRLEPFFYSLDTFLPIIDLQQESYWHPDVTAPPGSTLLGRPWGYWFRFYFWFHIAAGWFLSSLLVAALTGLIRKD